MVDEITAAMVPVQEKGISLNKTAKTLAIAKGKGYSGAYVPHLGINEIRAVANAAGSVGRNRQRDKLLVLTLFDGCLRVSEALKLRPRDIKQDDNGWHLEVLGKGRRPGAAAISPSLAAQLESYAYRHKMENL